MSGNAREAGRSTIDRLFTLLDAFDGDDLTLGEVAERSGLPLTTTHRMLAALERWGGVERDEDGSYSVGLRFWELGTRAAGPARLRELALPVMQDLYELTHQNVQLAVLDHGSALVIERLAGTRSVRTVTEVGSRLPLHATGVGKVLLASSPELLAGMTRHRLQRFTPYTLVMPGALVADVRRTAESSLGFSREEMTLGAASMAAPVCGAGPFQNAAIGIVTHSHVDLAGHAKLVRDAGRRLSQLLIQYAGGSPAVPSSPAVVAAKTRIRRNHHAAMAIRRHQMTRADAEVGSAEVAS